MDRRCLRPQHLTSLHPTSFRPTQQSLLQIILNCLELEYLKLPCFVYPPGEGTTSPILRALINRPATPKGLRCLGLSMCSGSEMDLHLPRLLAQHPTLTDLNISGNPLVTAASAASMSNLTRLVICSGGRIDDAFAVALAAHCPRIVHLDLTHSQLTEAGAAAILADLARLEYLSLAVNRRLMLAPLVVPTSGIGLLQREDAGAITGVGHEFVCAGYCCAGAELG
ncbi:hypothetical protein BDK51DRAFT_38011 [Blyttiomyces helicus]|uniref:RNI-like protein n=1 Tax=Blyttiomyces helicus TaxID=388810 RepID=A0A4P9WFQ3_9FUNG|nr:hypothetical protein BDK51DRAFT_38011 [Blyttiomyces helicus]|eukprot:RKO91599.1 hypothetical protein BDK51DRAFT_38011 [Blyttiomyces helicus]